MRRFSKLLIFLFLFGSSFSVFSAPNKKPYNREEFFGHLFTQVRDGLTAISEANRHPFLEGAQADVFIQQIRLEIYLQLVETFGLKKANQIFLGVEGADEGPMIHVIENGVDSFTLKPIRAELVLVTNLKIYFQTYLASLYTRLMEVE